MVLLNKFILTIPATKNFTFKIENRRVVKNIFSEELSDDLWIFNDV